MATSKDMKRSTGLRDGSLSPPPVKRKFESTTTKKAVANFFAPLSKKEPKAISWRIVNSTLLIGKYNPHTVDKATEPSLKRRKVAAFDLDSTLIQTISGNIFSKDATDWRWWHPSVPTALKKLHADNYIIVVLTNQGSLGLQTDPKTIKSDKRSLSLFKAKVCSVFNQLDFPIALYAATGRDQYRKPRTGMWNEVLEDFDLDDHEGPDLKESFFIGDAGGRPAKTSGKADHSCSDRDFATNVGITYHTPEEYFHNEAPQSYSRDFDPSTYIHPVSSTSTTTTPIIIEKKNSLDIVLFCGSPASGKSTFYWHNLRPLGYERVNQDILKTRDKCLKMASAFLLENKSVAVDNTNADPETRAVWIDLAQRSKVPIRCVHMTAPAKLCEHNDTVRALSDSVFNPEKRAILPHSAFASFASRFKEPKVQEGFQDVIRVEFQFQGDEEQQRLWSRYWI